MKRNVLVFGLILGTILAIGGVLMMDLVYNNPDIETNDPLGYAVMVIIFSLVFFGIRNYRNKELNGVISFGHAFKTGALIVLLGSTMYVVAGLAYYYLFIPDFLDKFAELVMNEATRQGATAAELAAKADQMEQFRNWFKNPVFAVLFTYAEVLPTGLVVAFVSSLILKKNPKELPANDNEITNHLRTMKTFTLLATILFVATIQFQPINAQDMNPKITTFLMFEGDAEEAITFYTSLFDDSEIVRIIKYGADGPGGPEAEGTVHNAVFTLKGQRYMAFDSYIEHGFTFTPSISLFVECDSEEELETLYEKLSDGGEVAMPLDNYGFSTKFGWVQDRFGVSWQLNYGQLVLE